MVKEHKLLMDTDLKNVFEELNLHTILPITTSEDIDYLMQEGANISYFTNARILNFKRSMFYREYGLGGMWCNNIRKKYAYTAKPGKIFKTLLGDTKPDQIVENCVHLWNTYIADLSKVNLQIWPSKKIPKAYLETNYFRKIGTLGNSCMRKPEHQKLLKFYVVNGVEIIVLLSLQGKIKARALLWPEMYFPKLKQHYRLMDRVYTTNDDYFDVFSKFATKQSFIKRKSYTNFYIKGKNFEDYIYLPDINLDGILCLPYTDTMTKLYYKDKILCNDRTAISNADIKLKHPNDILILHTTADYIDVLDPNVIKEIFTNNPLRKDKAVYLKKYDGYAAPENIVRIAKEEYHKRDDKICLVKLGSKEHWELKSKCIYSNICSCYIPKGKELIVSTIVKKPYPQEGLNVVDSDYIPDTKHHISHFTIQLDTGELLLNNKENRQYVIEIPGKSKFTLLKSPDDKIKEIPNHQQEFWNTSPSKYHYVGYNNIAIGCSSGYTETSGDLQAWWRAY